MTLFDRNGGYAGGNVREVLAGLAADSPGLPALTAFLEGEGYAVACNRDNEITVDWVKSYRRADERTVRAGSGPAGTV